MFKAGDRVSIEGFEETWLVVSKPSSSVYVLYSEQHDEYCSVPERLLVLRKPSGPEEPAVRSIIQFPGGYCHHRESDGFWYYVSKFGRMGRRFDELLSFEGTEEFVVLHDGGND